MSVQVIIPSTGSSSSATTPTTMQASLTVAAHTQLLFRRHIVMQAAQRITMGADAVLVGL